MTNHWRDIQHADVIMINGANPAEAHLVGFQHFLKAKLDPKRGVGKGGGAKMIHIDPRFTRTSAVSDIYARIRTGTDTAFFGGLINYVLEKNLIHHEYVRHYTNASFIVKDGFGSRKACSAATTPPSGSTTPRRGRTRGMRPPRPRSNALQKEIIAAGQGLPAPAPERRSPRHAARASALGVPAPA